MNDIDTNRIIIVLGAGRTGTSLLMQVLEKLGMTVSEVMTPPSEQNRMGGYEDSEVFKIHSDILRTLRTTQLIPLPDDWIENPEIKAAKRQLETVILNRTASAQTIWGVKDPRTALFLPLWIQIFNTHKLVPIYLLAVRAPGPAVRSLKKQYVQGEAISELFWLNKNCAALTHTGGNCFIVHYEDWFERPVELAQSLLTFTGLERHFAGNIQNLLKSVIRPTLNRSEFEPYQVKNRYVQQLYTALRSCQGNNFDVSRLMAVVSECQHTMDAFKGWYLEAQKYIAKQDALRVNFENLKVQFSKAHEEVSTLTKQVDAVQSSNRELASQIHAAQANDRALASQIDVAQRRNDTLMRELEKATEQAETLKNEADQVQSLSRQWKREHALIKNSLSFRMGNAMVLAFKHPGWKTIRLPYDLVMLLMRNFNAPVAPTQPKASPKPANQTRPSLPTIVVQQAGPMDTASQSALKDAMDKRLILIEQYRQASTRIHRLKSQAAGMEEDATGNGSSPDVTNAVVDAGRVLRELKAIEDAIADLKIRCHYE